MEEKFEKIEIKDKNSENFLKDVLIIAVDSRKGGEIN